MKVPMNFKRGRVVVLVCRDALGRFSFPSRCGRRAKRVGR